MREEFKNKKLELFDKQTEEQRKVFNELSKIGIRVENIIDNNFDNDINNDLLDNNNINPEIPVFNGENEFVIKNSILWSRFYKKNQRYVFCYRSINRNYPPLK